MTRDRLTLALAEASIVVGTGLGFALSYSSLRRLAAAHGYDGWESWLWPLAVDFVAIATTALAMVLAKRRHGPTGETWALAGAAALVSLAGNVLSAWGDPVAATMHAWAAAIYVGLWHAFFRSVQASDRTSAAALAPAQPVERSPEGLPPPPRGLAAVGPRRSSTTPPPGDARAQVRALAERARARGEQLTTAEVASAIRRSPQRARALLAEVRADMPGANGRGA